MEIFLFGGALFVAYANGASTGTSRRAVVGQIILAWLATLPLAALLAAGPYALLR